MTDTSAGPDVAAAVAVPSPGTVLRNARQAQGLHIAALAAALKVNPRKLELLENDQFGELPDVAFARALAQAVCRHLKIEAAPVLALLPTPAKEQPGLERVTNGLNTPFREHAQRHYEQGEWPAWLQAQLIVPLLLVLAALAFWFLPKSWVPMWFAGSVATAPAPAPAPSASAVPAQPGVALTVTPPTAVSALGSASGATWQGGPAVVAVPLASAATIATSTTGAAEPSEASEPISAESATAMQASAAAAIRSLPPGVLVLRASGESWIEVIDGRGDVLISRLLGPGEAVGLNGTSPLHLRVGNAEGLQVRYKGRAVPLRIARDNTARAELK